MALQQSVFAIMESLVPEYDAAGHVRAPGGSALPGITPSNANRTGDGAYVLIARNGASIYRRLMRLIGRSDLAEDPELAHNDGRNRHADRIDAAIGDWAARRDRDDILAALEARRVPAGFAIPPPTMPRTRITRRAG